MLAKPLSAAELCDAVRNQRPFDEERLDSILALEFASVLWQDR